jgi:hypothetical protein
MSFRGSSAAAADALDPSAQELVFFFRGRSRVSVIAMATIARE